MLKKIRRRLQSTSMEGGDLSAPLLQLKEDTKSKPSYHSILLNEFVEQVVEGSIDRDIYAEFLFRVQDTEQSHAMRLMKAINLLETKYNVILLVVKYLETEAKIKTINPDFVDQETEEIWKVLQSILPCRKTDSVQTILNRAVRLINERKNKEAELLSIKPVSEGGKADRSYFTRLIATVGAHHKMQINRATILLSEFVEYFLLMREYQQHLERELNKNQK